MTDTDKLLALDSFQDATESVYGYRPQVWATGNLMNQRDADRFYGWQMALRALAQPAEAVEDITDLVMQPGAACPTCCQALHVDTDSDDLLQAKAHADEGWRLAHEWMRRAQAAEATHDAAQGAVAWGASAETMCKVGAALCVLGHSSPESDEELCAAQDKWIAALSEEVLRRHATHPQAAPAQGDDHG